MLEIVNHDVVPSGSLYNENLDNLEKKTAVNNIKVSFFLKFSDYRFLCNCSISRFNIFITYFQSTELGNDAPKNIPPSLVKIDPGMERIYSQQECWRMRMASGSSTVHHDWIEQTFNKRECDAFICSSKDSNK